jgi:DNA-binding transcriptional LysR family regulator
VPKRSRRLDYLRFRHLQLVDTLIRLGTVHKAARALNLSQPAASAMLRDLEQALGAKLFERSRQGVTPTPAANALTGRARAIGHELDHAAADVAAAMHGAEAILTMGAMPRVMLGFMPQLMQRARREIPRLRFRLEEGVPAHLLPRLEDGRIDCLVSRLPQTAFASGRANALMHTRLYDDHSCMVCGPDHPFARSRKPELEQLAKADWILPPAETETRRVLVNTFLQAGISPPQPVIESLSVVANMAVVERAPLLTVAPVSAARARQKMGVLKILPVRVDTSVAPVSFIWRRAHDQSETIAQLRTLAERCAKDLQS